MGPCRRNTITEVAARASMPAESSLVSSTSSLPAPPAHECWRRLEPTSKRTATTGMNFSCAPALVQHQTNGNHCDELFLRASAGVRTRHCTVRTRYTRYLTANTYRLRGSSTSSLPAPPACKCWRRLEPLYSNHWDELFLSVRAVDKQASCIHSTSSPSPSYRRRRIIAPSNTPP